MRIKVSSTLPMRCRSRRKAIIHDVVGAFTTSSIRVHNKCTLLLLLGHIHMHNFLLFTCVLRICAHTPFHSSLRRVLPRIYYTSTYICMRRSCLVLLLSSPAEGGEEEECSGIARGELLLRCDCD